MKNLALLALLPLVSSHSAPNNRFLHVRRSLAHPRHQPRQEPAPATDAEGNVKAFITSHHSHLPTTPFTHIVVGGGQSGLVVARRLVEGNGGKAKGTATRVLVVEAGPDWAEHADDVVIGDGSKEVTKEDGEEEASQGWGGAESQSSDGILVKERVEIPGMAWYGGLAYPDSPYDWGYYTVEQEHLKGRKIYWPRGKILGGSSAVNGLYLVRSSEEEQTAWENLWNGQEAGEVKWDWEGVHPWLKKSENYTPPVQPFIDAGVVWDWDAHGTDGPIHYSYPSFFFEQIGTWLATFKNLGIGTREPGGGKGYDAFVATSAVNPTLHRRSYSRNAYIDPILGVEENLTILTGYHVTKVDFEKLEDGTLKATGITFKEKVDGAEHKVTIVDGGEVVISGGVIGSPQLLQLSGIGPKALLEKVGVEVLLDLPGVGQHLQDHLSSQITYLTTAEKTGDLIKANQTYAQEQLAIWRSGEGGSMYEAPNDAIAYVNLTTLLGEARAATFLQELNANLTDSLASLAALGAGDSVVKGYEATYVSEATDILPSPVGQIELLMSNTGRGAGGENSISLQVAIQHPFSRGHVSINSADAFDLPTIDVAYLSHPADMEIFREGFRFARKLAETPPLSEILIREIRPGPIVQTDEEWDHFIRSSASTEFHPAGSCSMLPLEKGGVVSKDLRVHGTKGLRVIDGSIVPVGLSAHLMAPIYGIAEKGAGLVLDSWNDYATNAAAQEDGMFDGGEYDIPGKVGNEDSKEGEETSETEDDDSGIQVTPVDEVETPTKVEDEDAVPEEDESADIFEGDDDSNGDGYGIVDDDISPVDEAEPITKIDEDINSQAGAESDSDAWSDFVVQVADYFGIFWFGNL